MQTTHPVCHWYTVMAAVVSSLSAVAPAAEPVKATVEVEEVVTRYESADNGAGPLWCYGSHVMARRGDDVYLSVIETGKDVPPLCNTRWQLWHRSAAGWRLVQHEKEYRQREPCPLAVFHDGPVFLSVNPSTQPPGTKYGPCRPLVLEFDPLDLAAPFKTHEPAWAEGTHFTDHSYRGFAADGAGRELLLLNINAQTGEYFVSHRDRAGGWHARKGIQFPIRACYPQVWLKDGAAHVMAIGDIVEPVEEWRNLKREVLKREWDYVFRRLFYTWTPDLGKTDFAEPIEVDTVEKTGGHIGNYDLYVDESRRVHLLYLKQPHQYGFLRDKYFAGQPMTVHLEHVVIENGKVASRQTLAETPADGKGFTPAFARFHVAPGGALYVVAAGTAPNAAGAPVFGNHLARLLPANARTDFAPLDMKHPFHSFFTNTPRGGSKPSAVIDMFGTAEDNPNLRYARIGIR